MLFQVRMDVHIPLDLPSEQANEIKTVETAVLKLINSIKDQDIMPVDKRWLAIGTTDIEKGFMSVIKGVCNNVN